MIATQRTWLADRGTARMVRARAARLGLLNEEFEDAKQEILVQLSRFQFDPEKSNGAARSTVLVAVIDRCLRMWLRSRRRYRDRFVQFQAASDGPRPAGSDEEPSYEEQTGIVLDVRQAVAQLDPSDQRLCAALGEGRTIDAIAAELGCSWHTVKRRVDQLRERFRLMNLNAWIS